MNKLYAAQFSSYYNRSVTQCVVTACRNIYSITFCLISLMLLANPAQAQQKTFYEGFDTTEPGELPEGWAVWQNGGGGAPLVYWTVFKYNPLGVEKYVMSMEEPGRDGMVDEDWLITPKITPVANDFLMFNCRRSFFESGDLFNILISTTTNEAPGAFTETLAEFTEADIPQSYDPVNGKIRVDLSAYVGIPIHIAFVHSANVGSEGMSSIWLLDDVEVRPKQAAYVEDTYFRQATSPPQPPIVLGNLAIPGNVSFVLNGDYGVANVSSITFSTEGTTDLSLIKEAKLYYTDTEYVTHEDIINGVLPLYGSVENPGETFEMTGSQDMALGTPHYFWMVYDLDDTRQLSFPYPQVDMTFEKFVVNGQEFEPEVKTYFGSLDVVPGSVVNDNFADAIEIAPLPARYGSSTYPATYEEDIDKLAYCQNSGFRNVHSVWWHFTAPADGWVSADLAESKFNTMMAFFDEDFTTLACNDDISDSQQQSRISDFPISKGKKIYIRVSDFGGCCGSEYSEAGVVIMDFSFAVPVGAEEGMSSGISALYPNPTSGITSLDLEVRKPGDVTLDVRDVMGKNMLIQKESFESAGKHTVSLDASAFTPGTYVIHVRGRGVEATRKLIVTR